jgi:hypothetical protein
VSRWVYLDEGGTSRHEPVVVVAGVMIDADKQLVRLEDHLQSLVEKHIPLEDWDGFVFHATAIWSGTRYFEDKEKWPLAKRLPILNDLVAIPRLFEIPITIGFVRRSDFGEIAALNMAKDLGKDELTPDETDIALHAMAFVNASLVVERTMRQLWKEEVALLIAEDRDRVKAQIKEMQLFLQNPKKIILLEKDADCLPLVKIRDTVHFAKKRESKALQIADICAFVLRGHLSGHPKNKPLYAALRPWMLAHPKGDIDAD